MRAIGRYGAEAPRKEAVMTQSLFPSPSLENLKKQAKTLLKAWRSGDTEAIARIRAAHPKFDGVAPQLSACQLVLARESGFQSWPQLRAAVEGANRDAPDEFVEIACLCYDDPHYDHRNFHARAHEMLRQKPWLAQANIWSAAVAGNAAGVRTLLDTEPELVNAPGLHGWTPLFCACYSRVKPLDAA